MAKEVLSALPYDLEAEQSVLGSMLIDVELQFEIRSKLKVEDFYLESHKLIFDGICSVLDSNRPVDVVTLTDEMAKTPVSSGKKRKADIASLAREMENNTTLQKAGGIEYLYELTRATPSAANYEYYLEIVKRDSTLRKLIRSADEIIKDARNSKDITTSVSFAEKSIFDISEQLDTSSLTNLYNNVDDVIEEYTKIQNDKNYLQGVNTGFTTYDYMTNGLHKGNLVIIAARPSVGKTTFVMNMVEHMATKQNSVCAVFALEMTKKELTERMIASLSGVPSNLAKKGKLEKEDWSKIWTAKKLLSKTNIYIDDTSNTTFPEILSKCRRLKAEKGRLDVIVVDHIQLMNAVKPNESRQAEITEISRGLKMIAKDLNVPVIALSQLSRAVEKSGRKPILSDLRESGAIEQDADVVMFIHRPNMTGEINEDEGKNQNKSQFDANANQDIAEIIVAKNRSGARGSFSVLFKGDVSRFFNIDNSIVEPDDTYNNKNSGLSQIVSDGDYDSQTPTENFDYQEEKGVDDVF